MPDGEKASLSDPSSAANQRADIYSTLGNFEKIICKVVYW